MRRYSCSESSPEWAITYGNLLLAIDRRVAQGQPTILLETTPQGELMTTFTDQILTRLQTLAAQHDCAILRANTRHGSYEEAPVRSIAAEDLNAIFPTELPADVQARQTRNNRLLKAFLEYKRYGVYTLIDRDGVIWYIATNLYHDADFLLTIARLGEYFQQSYIAFLPQNGTPFTVRTDPADAQLGRFDPLRKTLATYFQRAGGNGDLREWRETAGEIAQRDDASAKMAVRAVCRTIERELADMRIRIAPDQRYSQENEEIFFDFIELTKNI